MIKTNGTIISQKQNNLQTLSFKNLFKRAKKIFLRNGN